MGEGADLERASQRLAGVDGVLVPGGFGIRGVEGKIAAIRWAREHEVPFLGLCLGLQSAVIEFARHVVGLDDAHSSEFEPATPYPVIDLMADQRDVADKGGTMRLGAYPGEARRGDQDAGRLRRRTRHLRTAPPPLRGEHLDGRITSLNRAGQRLTGYSEAEATAMRVADFVSSAQRTLVEELIQRQVRERQGVTAEFEVVTRQGERRVLEVSTSLIEHDGAPVEIQGIARDVTERKEQEQALRSLTIIDDLTKLYNRRGFLTLAERHLKLAVRKKVGVFLLFADLDGLKIINDTFGHLEGDRALVDAADILRHSFRSADIIARLGGDEFTVFPDRGRAESASMLMGRLDEQLQRHNDANQSRGYRLALSVGIARFEPDSSWTIDQLLEHADKALYQQKRLRRP